ncbi:MAG TPA: hypothetical protein VK005_03365 [Acholeplasma sp.]|nr:hypothetical protein [Acholeplasma sp.]
MQLTKRQWLMFSFFIVNFAYILLAAALTGDFGVIFANLSILIFLAALYLERGYASRYYVLLAAVWLIVEFIMSWVFNGVIPTSIEGMLYLGTEIALYVAVGFFGYTYYHNLFKQNKYWILIIVLAAPTLAIELLYASSALAQFTLNIPPLTMIQIILSIIYSMTLPAVMIIYTIIRKKEITY